MSWSWDFQIKDKGQSPKKINRMAKMVIINSLLIFNFDSCRMDDSSVESTSHFFNEHKNKDIKFQSEAKQYISDLPDWVILHQQLFL